MVSLSPAFSIYDKLCQEEQSNLGQNFGKYRRYIVSAITQTYEQHFCSYLTAYFQYKSHIYGRDFRSGMFHHS